MFSLLIPAFNEGHSIQDTVLTAHRILTEAGEEFEIAVIDDGSHDHTSDILKQISLPNIRVLRHPHNRGYSASLKTGIRHTKGEIIGIVDADGTYPLTDFPLLLKAMHEREADMVVGARSKKGVKIPLIRRPAKYIVNMLARFLTGMRIPDLNSGMRIFSRPLAERFMSLYPQRFSFTITITLAALTNDYHVEYVPIHYFKRNGKSTLSSGTNGFKNFFLFLSLILRMIIHFRPLKVFLWPATILIVSGLGLTLSTIIINHDIFDSGILLIVSGLQIFLFGLLAEAVVRSRPIP
jgi:glycosyltransferase involved in cell wall biosynthesis